MILQPKRSAPPRDPNDAEHERQPSSRSRPVSEARTDEQDDAGCDFSVMLRLGLL
jgi:hypothetical protein